MTSRSAPRGAAALGAAAVAFALVACHPRSAPARTDAGGAPSTSGGCAYPIAFRDRRGVEGSLRAPARRIASLLPSHTETLFALGAGAAVIGVDDFSAAMHGAASLPRLGGLYDSHVEALLALQPDLALVADTSPVAAQLERAGVPTWGGSAARFDDVPGVIEAIAALVCRRAEGEHLVRQLAADVSAIERLAAPLPRVRVYYELDASLYTVGPRSFVGTMIAKAGGENIVPDGLGDFPKVSPEAVIAGDPAVVFGVTLQDARMRPGWERIRAVREGHVYELGEEQAGLVSRPGPRIADGLRILFERIHPEAAR